MSRTWVDDLEGWPQIAPPSSAIHSGCTTARLYWLIVASYFFKGCILTNALHLGTGKDLNPGPCKSGTIGNMTEYWTVAVVDPEVFFSFFSFFLIMKDMQRSCKGIVYTRCISCCITECQFAHWWETWCSSGVTLFTFVWRIINSIHHSNGTKTGVREFVQVKFSH